VPWNGGSSKQILLAFFNQGGNTNPNSVFIGGYTADRVDPVLAATNSTEIGSPLLAKLGATVRRDDSALTNTVQALLTVGHNTSGTPAAGFGGGVKAQLQSSTTADQDAAQWAAVWDTATHATRGASLRVYTVQNAGALTERGRFDGSATANDTGFWLWDANSATLKRVVVGVADSGGSGYRLLRVAN
jgi:hypothetical protein